VSLLLKWTVPLYRVTGFPWSFSAVTTMVKACLAVTVAGAWPTRTLTTGAPVKKASKMFAVVRWIRASATLDPLLKKSTSPQLHDIVPDEKTHAPLGAW